MAARRGTGKAGQVAGQEERHAFRGTSGQVRAAQLAVQAAPAVQLYRLGAEVLGDRRGAAPHHLYVEVLQAGRQQYHRQ